MKCSRPFSAVMKSFPHRAQGGNGAARVGRQHDRVFCSPAIPVGCRRAMGAMPLHQGKVKGAREPGGKIQEFAVVTASSSIPDIQRSPATGDCDRLVRGSIPNIVPPRRCPPPLPPPHLFRHSLDSRVAESFLFLHHHLFLPLARPPPPLPLHGRRCPAEPSLLTGTGHWLDPPGACTRPRTRRPNHCRFRPPLPTSSGTPCLQLRWGLPT
jgi:hypothetical protein